MYFNYEWTINGYIYLGEIMERNISTKLLNFSRKLNKYLKLDTSPNYGEIKNPLEHVNHRYGNGWTYSSINILELFEPINMNEVRLLKQYRLPKSEKVLLQKELPKSETSIGLFSIEKLINSKKIIKWN